MTVQLAYSILFFLLVGFFVPDLGEDGPGSMNIYNENPIIMTSPVTKIDNCVLSKFMHL